MLKKIELDLSRIREALEATDIKKGTYDSIMNDLSKIDISQSAKYIKTYSSYYGMSRFRKDDYKKIYFDFLEKNKYNQALEFSEIINHMYAETGKCDASFSSKLLHTVLPDKPIIDSRVVYHLSWKKPQKLHDVIDFYDEMVFRYEEYMKMRGCAEIIATFDTLFPETHWTPMKKLDTAIWSLGRAGKRGEC
jgi:hypothetical protein